jgi:hypothetical protein
VYAVVRMHISLKIENKLLHLVYMLVVAVENHDLEIRSREG